MTGRFVDAHCHLQDPRLRTSLPEVLRRASEHGLTHICTCSCNEDEWNNFPSLVQDIASPTPKIVPAFGLHPWYAGDASPSYLDSLRTTLQRYPSALVGEIGLCKSRRGKQVPLHVQEQRCREQLELSEQLGRPVVLHCVAAHGKLFDLLAAAPSLPHAILHAYSGSADMVKAFTKLPFPVYVSFTARQCVDMVQSDKLRSTFAAVPSSRLLLETDAPDQRPSVLGSSAMAVLLDLELNDPVAVKMAVEVVAESTGKSADVVAAQVYANAIDAFWVENTGI
ncbi:hypothetical protein H257_15565 [Aphanomyces astaci]|uniref:Uncharacterized protein n=1 Tax=Aphanomyces astaci TaxID=112090 RepID=W4FP52_APHAT|nr:hypothetical protein H257_15565 [Aphanomyces astaci]ETV68589.1 hypothetical protein H257_15565 [Aphanomyces astaci]|eukprot:XP_009842018.1 hypothetical protein H257_15565 [Aphanomyces astaci]